jgi:hypothetical protein
VIAMAANPFYFNTPTKPQDFTGRGELLEKMVDGLESGRPDSYGIVGGRRFGKSSLIVALAHRLGEDLKQDVVGDMRVIPVIVSLKGVTPASPADVFGFACHRIRKATWGKKRALPSLPGPIIELGLPEYAQGEPSPASVQGIETAVDEVITAAYDRIGEVRIALMLDEIEHTLSYPWTADLFANLRYLVYDSDYKPYIRLITAGTGRYLGLNEKGSPLFNAITGCFLEPFDAEGVAKLLGRAPGLTPEIAEAIALQGGGHPFILQHLLYYLTEKDTAARTLDAVTSEVNHFRLARLTDLNAWWDDILEDGRRIYHVLCQADDWMTVAEIARAVTEDVQKERGLRELTCHGFIIHDGTYQRYRVHGRLFRDWFMERYRPPGSPSHSSTEGNPMLSQEEVRLMALRQQVREALLDAFPTEDSLKQMLYFGLNVNIAVVAGGSNLGERAGNLIIWAESAGKFDALIVAARNQNPTNPRLRDLAEGRLLVPTLGPGKLEEMVLRSVHFQDGESWRARMIECELAVCLVEVTLKNGASKTGTGFLVGPDLVMTAYHVLREVIQDPTLSTGVLMRFDYKTTAAGVELNPGKEYRLLTGSNWLVANSTAENLDYALLRTAGAPGNDTVGGQEGAPQRSWLRPVGHPFEIGEPLLTIQHPKAARLKFAPGSITNVTGARVIYTTPTKVGSSGAPCFTADWELVAIHHLGDPTGNEGIDFSAILAQPGVRTALGL